MTADDRQRLMHLSLNLSGVGRHTAAWTHPASVPGAELDVDHFVQVARVAEEGLFDAVFLADSPALTPGERGVPHRFEPLTLLTAIAVATGRIGLIGTVSTTYNDPLTVADRARSLHTLSAGRAAINAVASAGDRIAANFGLAAQPSHGERYARAEAFLTAVEERWAQAPPTGQGRPLIVQAGGSSRGRDLAARHADVVYAGGYGIDDALALDADIRARAVRQGRAARSLRVLPGVIPYLADTTAEAHRLADRLDAVQRGVIDPIAWLGPVVGADLTGHDPDGPLPTEALPTDPDKLSGASLAGLARTLGEREGLTVRGIAERLHAGGFGNIQTHVHGTADEIAGRLIAWFRRGVDGFNLLLPLQPSGVERFVAEVVPLLQRAGVYRTGYEAETLAGHLGLTAGDAGDTGDAVLAGPTPGRAS
ncbi:LLM class flavin-dependent oxidoreductase [Streptomyces radicis]|uniref:LLM class flavin-dependent oxidoreductase n=1 Tax=Streptomyces radicis TaxID=1750517 RepID=A0A3A9WAH8_9ACTN|nr:LLM class flavin-dependent oxidoreductase [Streptomyces radicis]RKN04596.1 LLM class flavin-dependent oxidoreductase [Streptomyces radicis]RKN15553.1 LLM class flavin-dependent oxidoreductase [Streptomyces radicis]